MMRAQRNGCAFLYVFCRSNLGPFSVRFRYHNLWVILKIINFFGTFFAIYLVVLKKSRTFAPEFYAGGKCLL